jgi:predicted deacylase
MSNSRISTKVSDHIQTASLAKNPRQPFELGGRQVEAGSRLTIDLPIAQLYTHTPITMPVHVIHGRQEGPTLLICAAIHGDEINGVEIIRRLLRLPQLNRVAGTALAVPIVNVLGFIDRTRYLPDRRDLNRSFPGSQQGSLAGRIAHMFKINVLDKATHVIDLHTAAQHRTNLPQVRANLTDSGSAAIAQAFDVPVVINSPLIEGSLRYVADLQKIPVVTYESGEALRFDEHGIRAGVRGIVRVMRHLGMLPALKNKSSPAQRTHFIADSSNWVRAEQDGIFRAAIGLGAHVRKGQALGYIADPFGEREIRVEASFSGIIIGRANLPLVHEGEALFHIAKVEATNRVVRHVETFQERLAGEEDVLGEPPIV